MLESVKWSVFNRLRVETYTTWCFNLGKHNEQRLNILQPVSCESGGWLQWTCGKVGKETQLRRRTEYARRYKNCAGKYGKQAGEGLGHNARLGPDETKVSCGL